LPNHQNQHAPCCGISDQEQTWSSSSLGRWHPRSSVLLVLTRHSLPILNEQWTRVINLSMFFLLCYDLTTILRSRAQHQILSLAIQYAWCSYMLSRLYRKVKTFRSNLLTTWQKIGRTAFCLGKKLEGLCTKHVLHWASHLIMILSMYTIIRFSVCASAPSWHRVSLKSV
jgi:hypothetical protein